MATIVTNANWLQVDGARLQKGKWDLALTSAGVRLSDAGQSVNIPYMDTTIDGDPVESSADLFAFFEAQGFKSGGTGPGTGVQSVNGKSGTSVNLGAEDINTQYIIAGETEEGTIQEGMTAYGHQIDGIWNNLNSLPPVASTGSYDDLTDKPTLGTAAAADTTDFATAAQGALADTAVQPSGVLDIVRSEQEGGVGTVITNIISMTQAEYDGLSSTNSSTFYIITD